MTGKVLLGRSSKTTTAISTAPPRGDGSRDGGTVFQLPPAGVVTVLYSLGNGYDGAEPDAGVTQGSNGNFHGTTRLGGHGAGTVFQLSEIAPV